MVTITRTSFEPAPPLPDWLAPLLPYPRFVHRVREGTDAGKRIHFLERGAPTGRPVVMFHGNPTWSFLWRKVIALLDPGRFRVIAADMLGFGLSDSPGGLRDHSVARHADALADLLLALDLKDAIFVGQDWGGPMTSTIGARLPERVTGLVLGNTSVLTPASPRGTKFHRLARKPIVSDVLFRLLGFPMNTLHRVQGDPRSISDEVSRAYKWPLRSWSRRAGPLALARMVPSFPEHESLPELRRGETWARAFQGPVALVWGEKDPILGRALAKHQEAFPRASVTRTQAGHFLQEEVPDAIAAAIESVSR